MPLTEQLEELAEYAKKVAVNPPLARPHAKNADRTNLAKLISEVLRDQTGAFRHEAAASLVNAIFPDKEAIDASYIQSVARTIK